MKSTTSISMALGLSLLASGVGCGKNDDHREARTEAERSAIKVNADIKQVLHDAHETADKAIRQAANTTELNFRAAERQIR